MAIHLCTRSQLKGGVTYVRLRSHARVYACALYLVGGGLIIEANIPVQELDGQRGEGAYFRRGLIFGRIRYYYYRHHICNIIMTLYEKSSHKRQSSPHLKRLLN